MKKLIVLVLTAALLLTSSCSFRDLSGVTDEPAADLQVAPVPVDTPPETAPTPASDNAGTDAGMNTGESNAANRDAELLANAVSIAERAFDGDFSTEEFLLWLKDGAFPAVLTRLEGCDSGDDVMTLLREETGESFSVLRDRFNGLLDSPETAAASGIYFADGNNGDEVVLAFAGDVNLTDGGYVMPVYNSAKNGVSDIFKGGLLEEMQSADVFLINNEFAFTDHKTALSGKTYTFRSKPSNVQILADMGVDVVFLANNHVYDFGADGLADTLETLDSAGIPRFGAGRNIEEASRPVYYIAGGMKIAYVGAGCIERYTIFTPGAGETSPGIFRADEKNAERFLEVVAEAASQSDFVVASFHWGVENTAKVEDYQRKLAQMSIDAGADAVVGAHPHVLQGAEFYNGKPIIYSTGNFWFSRANKDTCLLKLIPEVGGGTAVQLLPCIASGGIVSLASGSAADRILKYYESISYGAAIDSEGFIRNAA